MSEQQIKIPTMHEDHRVWQSEHAMWQQDLESWNKQLAAGLSELEEVQQMLTHQQIVLREHNQAIVDQEADVKRHEHELANCEKLGVSYEESLTEKHFKMKEEFERSRNDHDRIKKYHHNLAAKLNELVTTMEIPM